MALSVDWQSDEHNNNDHMHVFLVEPPNGTREVEGVCELCGLRRTMYVSDLEKGWKQLSKESESE